MPNTAKQLTILEYSFIRFNVDLMSSSSIRDDTTVNVNVLYTDERQNLIREIAVVRSIAFDDDTPHTLVV